VSKDVPPGEDDYSDYIETSDVIMEYYKNQKTYGLDKYYIEIEDWLKKKNVDGEPNVPL